MLCKTALFAVMTAAVLDQCIGDPRWCLHPVVVMGWLISRLRSIAEALAENQPWRLRVAGALITALLVGASCGLGWCIERLLMQRDPALAWIGFMLLVIGLASCLAARSLRDSVMAVLKALPSKQGDDDLSRARHQLRWIVGRDVRRLDRQQILRAAAETASENAVDGLFAPLFWMFVGTALWQWSELWPGPLALAWGFKAASTLDSMLGYRSDQLRWLGTAGARLDDLLTWLPCRMVMVSLPLVSCPIWRMPALVAAAERDGSADPSPNAGRSEAIYAHCAAVCLGGANRYDDHWVEKPALASHHPPATTESVHRILRLTTRLQLFWLMMAALLLKWFSC